MSKNKTTKENVVESSPSGINRLKVREFRNKQSLMNHIKNGRTHEIVPQMNMSKKP